MASAVVAPVVTALEIFATISAAARRAVSREPAKKELLDWSSFFVLKVNQASISSMCLLRIPNG